MLIIRFSRQGKRKRPFYRLIISEKARDTQGVYLELLGTYDPLTKEARLKTERISHWLKQGAQTSNSVNNLLINQGLIKGKKRKSVSISRERHVKIDAKKYRDTAKKFNKGYEICPEWDKADGSEKSHGSRKVRHLSPSGVDKQSADSDAEYEKGRVGVAPRTFLTERMNHTNKIIINKA